PVAPPAPPTLSPLFFHGSPRRNGDYAIVGLAAQAIVRGEQFADIRLGFFAIGDRPLLANAASRLIECAITPAILSEASSLLSQELDPPDYRQATPAMRRHLAK